MHIFWCFFGITDKMCEKVNCGKGKCRADMTRPFNFRCECEPGWKKTKDNDEDNDHTFLPCIIPECKLFLVIIVLNFWIPFLYIGSDFPMAKG